ncbi:MAG: SCO1664 family protein [Gordonia sp. (in: high G+C Gram-positive bacteria)]|uniref:SCO1664 family protein n=1 Tax=Gordonia TaxID=2053 RepID=UPI003267124F
MNADCLDLLATGELTVLGAIGSASNLTVACEVSDGAVTMRCVYKPVRGEEPLWDFPDGTLAGREVASYLISDALGWDLIPDTVLRADGPADVDLGPGMVQRWITAHPDDGDGDDGPGDDGTGDERIEAVDIVPAGAVPPGYCRVLNAYDQRGNHVVLVHENSDRLRRLAVLDVILNNADRKGGHILVDRDRRLYGIDHGICLHRERKLRTVLWGWARTPVPESDIADLRRLGTALDDPRGPLVTRLSALITEAEIDALARRVATLVGDPIMPAPPADRAIPWPPF